nr:transposase [uncultured Propionivibrio sp.]
MKKRFSEEQIIGFLKQAEAGVPVKELCRQHGFSDASFYTWRAKFGGMTVPDAIVSESLPFHRQASNATQQATKVSQLFRRTRSSTDEEPACI